MGRPLLSDCRQLAVKDTLRLLMFHVKHKHCAGGWLGSQGYWMLQELAWVYASRTGCKVTCPRKWPSPGLPGPQTGSWTHPSARRPGRSRAWVFIRSTRSLDTRIRGPGERSEGLALHIVANIVPCRRGPRRMTTHSSPKSAYGAGFVHGMRTIEGSI